MKRRRFLGIATTASVVGLAGCGGGGENDDSGGNTDSTENGDSEENTDSTENGDDSAQDGGQQSSSIAVAEAYYTAESVETAGEFVHPASDLEPNSSEYTDQFEVEFLEGEVIAEDVDIQVLEDEGLALYEITEEVLEDINESEGVHLVEATFEYTSGDESDEVPQTVLTATDDSDWYVLDTPAETAG
jgi:hypothetical protein